MVAEHVPSKLFPVAKEIKGKKHKMNGLNAATFGALCVAASAHVSTHVSTRIYGSKSKYYIVVSAKVRGEQKRPHGEQHGGV